MLKETSFAIHPQKYMDHRGDEWLDIGSSESVETKADEVKIKTKTGEISILQINKHVLRVVANPFGAVSHLTSPAVIHQGKRMPLNVEQDEQSLLIKGHQLHVRVEKSPVRISIQDTQGYCFLNEDVKGMAYKPSGEIICYKNMEEDDQFYGFGEKPGGLNKRGVRMEMWNTDMYVPHNPETDTLYQSIPFFITLRKGRAHGVYFDNTFRTTFDLKNEQAHYSFASEGGQLDYYVLTGPTIKDVVAQYTELTGRAPLPPKWSLGYHQSRYSYKSEEEVREIVRTFQQKGIPLDVIHLDIHYMNGYRVFTFDGNRFPHPKELIAELKEHGIHVVPIVDPGVKVDPEYTIYQEGVRGDYFCKYIEGSIYFGEVWPGLSAFPDFTDERVRTWWGEKQTFYTDLGVEGIWNDMNEPAVFNETKTMDEKVMHQNDGRPKTHRELHNIYGFRMTQATYEGLKKNLQGRRPFVLTRAGFAGIQRYSAVWTGDNRSFWEHLQLSLPMVMNLGLSGVAFAGPDVGGFDYHANGELLARWTQVGAFTPFFRNHSAIGSDRQEPWCFGEQYEKIIHQYISLRYQWLPQLYTLFYEAYETGLPVMRPLVLEYPEDEKTYHLSDQFMIGTNVIVAPVMTPRTEHRVVYLPEGTWVDYWNEDVYAGGQHHMVYAPLDKLPVFIKKGSMIVLGKERQNSTEVDDIRYIHFYYGNDGRFSFTLYEDDGKTFAYQEGEWQKLVLHARTHTDELHLDIQLEGSYTPDVAVYQLIVHQADSVRNIRINGKRVSFNRDQGGRIVCTLNPWLVR